MSDRSPAPRPLRIAVIGAGKMGEHHLRAILRTTDVARLVGVVDPHPDAAARVARLAPDVPVVRSLEVLVERTPVDVVHVCTAPETHFSLASDAIARGCHVYVEKPFVESAREAEQLLALARAQGVRVCAGHQLLFEAPARAVDALLPALGQLAHVESYFSFRTVRRTPNGRTPLRADLQLLDILPHPLYLLLAALERAVPEGATELRGLEVGPRGTVHALVRRGAVTGTLVVTLDGRPVESYLRLVGTNGTVHADFVRSTVQRQLGPGTSGIDKALSPYRLARQLVSGTTRALAARVAKRQRSYPGLVELFEAFYRSARGERPAPFSDDALLETTRLWERIAVAIADAKATSTARPEGPAVLVTGGSGFLGREVVAALRARGRRVRVVARRLPAPWDRLPDVEYVASELAAAPLASVLADVDVVVHCAAETAGGWDEHQRNSIDATAAVVRAAAAARVRGVLHVSSLAVLAERGDRVGDDAPLHADSRERGPYVWGKLESERLAVQLGAELGVAVRVVRPGALVDYQAYEPPGRLGKRLGDIFVAVGSPAERLGVVEVQFAGRVLAWLCDRVEAAPAALNLLSPTLPTRRELVERLRRVNPDLAVVRIPRPVLAGLSLVARLAQRVLRPGKPVIDVAKVFATPRYDTAAIAAIAERMETEPAPATPPRSTVVPSPRQADAGARAAAALS